MEEGSRKGYLVFRPDGVQFHPSFNTEQVISFLAEEIVDVVVHEDVEQSQRYTFTRLWLFNRFAMAMPKTSRQERTIITVVVNDESEHTFALQNKAASVWASVSPYVKNYHGAFADGSAGVSVADELDHLSQLYESGVLSEEEFAAAKNLL